MKGLSITCNGVTLPSPTGHSESLELLWSSNTGRGATGDMIGDVITEKQTHRLTWNFLTEAEKELIESSLPTRDQGFASVVIKKAFGTTTKTIPLDAYRGSISAETAGVYGGQYYYRTVSTDIIEQ